MAIDGDKADGSVTSSSPTSSQLPDWPLRRPASRRISNPVSLRLQTITEGPAPNVPPVPPRSSMRDSGSDWSLHNYDYGALPPPSRDGHSTTGRPGQAPPAYGWVPDPNPSDANVDGRAPVEGEKLAKLRRGGGYIRDNRGGMKRLLLILGILFIIIIGLAVGLGVGLTVGRHNSGKSSQPQQSGLPSGTDPSTGQQNQPFPLGQYSFNSQLQTVETNCTSIDTTWNCPTGSNFNWIIAKTDDNYATVTSGATPDAGVPANLTISSSSDPFAANFTDQSMTYIGSSTNSSAARLTFSFTAPKIVFPNPSLAGDSLSKCFYNQTTFTATLYLRQTPGTNSSSSTVGSYQQWPFAIEITQSIPGGADIPSCYNVNNGDPITAGLKSQSSSQQCVCGWGS